MKCPSCNKEIDSSATFCGYCGINIEKNNSLESTQVQSTGMFKNSFSFEGRIRRTEYGISLLIYLVFYFVFFFSIGMGVFGSIGVFRLIILIPLLWFLWAQGAKRCHDVGNSGWFQIIPFYVFWLLFQEGQNGLNEYGPSPK
jgi:uncharacterized membrane protein YhaH (DUF805 family)